MTGEVFKVVIKNAGGTTPDCPLTVNCGANVAELKKQISEEYVGRPTVDRMDLLFSGRCALASSDSFSASSCVMISFQGVLFFIWPRKTKKNSRTILVVYIPLQAFLYIFLGLRSSLPNSDAFACLLCGLHGDLRAVLCMSFVALYASSPVI
jgi:hypothetical protein